jgi:membrane protease YdiL (CAAX protease family)
LKRAGSGDNATLIISSVAFMLWHVSAVTLETGFAPPAEQVPVYLVNATLLGLVWGLLRKISGSVVVAAVSHGIWNGLVYVLFGFGDKTGALGIQDSGIYGPELGYLGIVLNLAFAAWLWRRSKRS